jgi:hypothetical protein
VTSSLGRYHRPLIREADRDRPVLHLPCDGVQAPPWVCGDEPRIGSPPPLVDPGVDGSIST